ncbi:ATP-binding cassette domain-containing protein [Microbacterium stercoris]|uniref:ABC transporter ATP-binding protein n=1 Tax=Microbacterium stercoris TaxID=2820289 RepID=A0A939QIK4_9MICO|nr:ABC transporter ATP-binding protein [Microbacterium stercoris]MBO3663577.1 ABC transporter ATP-binding protein [Microbacterium stercoris]
MTIAIASPAAADDIAPAPETAVRVDGLDVSYVRGRWATRVVSGFSLELAAGETVAIVGESGSGKTTVAAAISGLLPANGLIDTGSIEIFGQGVSGYDARAWRPLRGAVIGYVPQDPLSSLDPLQRVGDQVADAVRQHRAVTTPEAHEIAVDLLTRVGIREPAERARAFPHQLSGGQLQRILIAIAIAGEPRLLIADEPTSALDVTVQRTILDLIDELKRDLGLSVVLITHDLAIAEERSDRLVVLRSGEIREAGPTAEIIARPVDDYTVRLFADAPALSPDKFAGRKAGAGGAPVIEVAGLTKTFRSLAGDGQVAALADVSLSVTEGTIHALVGESGSGKTTAARIIAGLADFDAGAVSVLGRHLPPRHAATNPDATRLQLIYQNALAAFDPRWSIEASLEEPLRINGIESSRVARRAAVREILADVGLPADAGRRRPSELSGGQRQRAAIARALILRPRVLILDEPTSALDVSVQSQIVDLLFALREQHGLTYLFISHDLSLVRQIADDVTVLEKGKVMESGAVEHVFENPQAAYTVRLIESIPGGAR